MSKIAKAANENCCETKEFHNFATHTVNLSYGEKALAAINKY